MKKRVLFFLSIFFILISLTIVIAFNFNHLFDKKLEVTEEHPFLINGSWVKAKDLKIGDELANIDGKKVKITNITNIDKKIEVYNLEVGNYSDFIVNGVIVHNSNLVELSSTEKARLRRGEFNSEELGRIEDAKKILREKGLEEDLRLLDDVDNQAELLISHYSGNKEDGGINIFTKAKPLLSRGFSSDGIEELADNWIIGFREDRAFRTPDFIESPGVGHKIPVPSEETVPVYNRDWFMQQYSSITDPFRREALETIADNVQHIDFPTFRKDLDDAVQSFNEYIGKEPYIVVFRRDGKSQPWVYDLVQDNLANKPVDFVFLKNARDDELYKYFDKGIKKFVIFDDATYTGTQLATNEFGEQIHQQFRGWLNEGINSHKYPQGIEYVAVTSAYTKAALEKFQALESMYTRGSPYRAVKNTLVSSREIKTMDQILSEEQILELHPFGIDYDGKQTLTFYDHKVPDSVSLPDSVYDSLRFKDGKPYGPGIEPYKKQGTDYAAYWFTEFMARLLLIFKFFLIQLNSILP